MGRVTDAVVEQVDSKMVPVRGKSVPTYSFKAGMWYRTNFKDSGVQVGDVVSFAYTESKYGKDVDLSTLVVVPASGPPKTAPEPAPRQDPPFRSGGGKGVFPIPPLDGQRSIVRQNALTNARELMCAANGPKGFPIDPNMLDQLIAIARRFEAYACGDEEVAAVASESAD